MAQCRHLAKTGIATYRWHIGGIIIVARYELLFINLLRQYFIHEHHRASILARDSRRRPRALVITHHLLVTAIIVKQVSLHTPSLSSPAHHCPIPGRRQSSVDITISYY